MNKDKDIDNLLMKAINYAREEMYFEQFDRFYSTHPKLFIRTMNKFLERKVEEECLKNNKDG